MERTSPGARVITDVTPSAGFELEGYISNYTGRWVRGVQQKSSPGARDASSAPVQLVRTALRAAARQVIC